MSKKFSKSDTLHILAPLLACAILVVAWGQPMGWALLILVSVSLVAAVLQGVHHAEVVAARVGEPFGTLILALAVTVIEVGLIGSIMLSGSPQANSLARDTLFATVMVVCNLVVGLCLVMGAARHRVLPFRTEGVNHALATLTPMLALTLVLPNYTVSVAGPVYSPSQLVFAGLASLTLYAVFVFAQTVRHRDYFVVADSEDDERPMKPSVQTTFGSAVLLLMSLVAVVGLAKQLSPSIEGVVHAVGAPHSMVGLLIALIVLAPESLAAVRAALHNRMQTSLNLALGSALASIGLTIPAVAVLSMMMGMPLVLGLGPAQIVLLTMTLLLTVITLALGRATVLHGAVHLVVFAAFLVLSLVP